MTQLEAARQGQITEEMQAAAQEEKQDVEIIRQGIAEGTIVLPANINHPKKRVLAVGSGLRTKVNANIGTSTARVSLEDELVKLEVAITAGADSIMDLSTGGDLDANRRIVLENCPVMVGTVPLYQAMVEAREKYGAAVQMTVDDLFTVIEKHARDGVDFITVHCGVTMEVIQVLRAQGRVADIVSRGGSFTAGWMMYNKEENPLYRYYDRLLEICREYDVTLSLGDGLRPGCLADATDRAQIAELVVLGELVEKARRAGVQVMVEGPGHVPLDQIEANIRVQKSIAKGAPFYVLGPLVTDVAPGYDHITAAIGGALAAKAGADFLCYVTPAEHLGLPTAGDVREGVMACRLAGHAADIVKGVPGAAEWDRSMSAARRNLDWERQKELALDPEKFDSYRRGNTMAGEDGCTMCGEYCALKIVDNYLGKTGSC